MLNTVGVMAYSKAQQTQKVSFGNDNTNTSTGIQFVNALRKNMNGIYTGDYRGFAVNQFLRVTNKLIKEGHDNMSLKDFQKELDKYNNEIDHNDYRV